MAISTLKKRAEFLAVRGGQRASVPSFLMEGKLRAQSKCKETGPRFGFTVTKKLGGAVVRNRIRRRIKSAIAETLPMGAEDGFDYVVVARPAALERPFQELISDVQRALATIHKSPNRRANPPAASKKPIDPRRNSGKIPGT